jgi:hypothetical protein
MTNIFMIGETVEGLTPLAELDIPLPDPQHEYRQFKRKDRLGDLTMKGRGPATIIWEFPLPEVEQIMQVDTFQSGDPIFIQSPNKDDVDTIFHVLINLPDPRESGDHQPGFRGYRKGFIVEFIVLAEVGGSGS